MTFEVSDPGFHVDGDLNLVSQQDDPYRSPVLLIHGLSAHADDRAQVEVVGLPVSSPHTLRVSVNRRLWCVFVCGVLLPYSYVVKIASVTRHVR